ncbi:hypothetical protein NQ317_005205 [Molorchus minor]|uniref:Uncharacterized protein n=1 Tax=Molorchus minor TaxID=1323400 RepID=A0ABQ9JPT4_9CUCU|nr:hypothetical protein NQ317_005205 [Molorchus minor]
MENKHLEICEIFSVNLYTVCTLASLQVSNPSVFVAQLMAQLSCDIVEVSKDPKFGLLFYSMFAIEASFFVFSDLKFFV